MCAVRLTIDSLGPIGSADLAFDDLTVLTGPQASGKSVALQLLKLVLDRAAIEHRMRDQNVVWGGSEDFFDAYFGEGMRSLLDPRTRVTVDGVAFDLTTDTLVKRANANHERVAYVPAQRVMSIRDGLTRPFGEYRAGDPYVLRAFSADVHDVVQKELSADGPIFPRPQRFSEALRNVVASNVLASWELRVEAAGLEKRFVLVDPTTHDAARLPFLTWSAGQREFVPLLLGLYRLMPAGSRPRRGRLEWVVIEEPEMGLHPRAIAATMAFVLELLRRRYRVVLSTHSTQVLDVVWGLRRLQAAKAGWADVLRMLGLEQERSLRSAAERSLTATITTYYFERGAPTRDISDLDPLAEDAAEAGWGGLTAFSERVATVVSEVTRRADTVEGRE